MKDNYVRRLDVINLLIRLQHDYAADKALQRGIEMMTRLPGKDLKEQE